MKAEDLIVKDGSITLRSMLDFGGFLEIKRFLEACHSENCTVTFANEEIVIFPNDYDASKDALVFIYGTLAERHDVIEKYLRYKLMLGDEEPKPTLHSQRKGNDMKTVKLSEQSLKLVKTLCDYTDKPDILNAVADALYYDADELKRRINQLAEEVK